MAELVGDQLVKDTVASVSESGTEYTAVVRGNRRWVAISDEGPNLMLRTFYSDTTGIWHEVPSVGLGNNGVTIGAINDTAALVVWAGMSKGLKWGQISGSRWIPGTAELQVYAKRLHMRPHPDSGFWLGVAAGNIVNLTQFTASGWTDIDTLSCAYPGPVANYDVDSPNLSRDSAPRPVVAWGWQSGTFGVCVCFPTDSGYGLAENIPDAVNGVLPSVAVDENGDTWLSWWRYGETVHWKHTYVVATATDLTVQGTGAGRSLAWKLTQPAPGGWWAVMRSNGGGEFERVARVQSATGVDVAWTDDSPASGVLRYKIRRESTDARYRWLGDEVVWDESTAAELSLLSTEVTSDTVVLTWFGSGAGTLAARVERRTRRTEWADLGIATPIGPDELRYADHAVQAGERYAYRLIYDDASTPRFTTEAWIDVPKGPQLALEGFLPNPADAGAWVAFTLPSPGDARLELLDISGRRVAWQLERGLAAGRHALRVDRSAGVPPGVYLIRLRFGDQTLTARGVVTR